MLIPQVCTPGKILNLSTISKILLKTNVIEGSIVNGSRQPIFYSFVPDNPPGCKVFSAPETMHYKITKKFVSNSITFSLEDDNHEEVNFNGEALTFTLQIIKI